MRTRIGWRAAALAFALVAAALPQPQARAGLAGQDGQAADAVDETDETDATPEETAEERTPFLGGFLRETRVVYPLQVAGWDAAGERMYDVAELGASVRYQSGERSDRWIDIYFYPVGVVPDSHLDEAARAALDEVRMRVDTPGGYSGAEFGPLRSFEVPRGEGEPPLPARSADMRLRLEDGALYHSAMALLIDRMYYVKGRYSAASDAVGREEVRRTLETFMAELVPATRIGSTGACWSPAPIEALPAGADAPADARLSVTSGDGAGAWLVGGRVLAHDPAGEAARTLAALAMGLDGRLHPGCVGAEPHNPEVPEGYREIRFEYRAPAGARQNGTPRLQAPQGRLG